MSRQNSIGSIARHSSIAFSVLLTSSAAAVGQGVEPSKCVRPTLAGPAAFVQTPLNPSLPTLTTINVRAQGAAGDGTTIDSAAIQSIINSNPNGTIYFPMGLYRLHNANNQQGLIFNNFHGTAVMQNGARFLCDTVTVGSAGECIRIVNSSNASFGNLRIGYIGDSVLPYVRSLAGNTALLVENSQNVTITNTTIEHSPGPGIWVDNSSGIKLVGGTSVNDVTADGLHFENDANSSIDGYFSQNTGDDGFGVSSAVTNGKACGVTGTNLQIYRSLSVGISVHGACNTSISNFYIDTTASSGLLVTDDASFDMHGTTGTSFANGTVLSSGRAISPIVGGKDCLDIALSQGTTVNSVACVYPLSNGVFVDDAASAVTLNGVTVDAAPNLGFGVTNATNVVLTNTISRGSAGGGYVFNTGYVGGSVTGAYACNSGKYGFYHAGVSNVAESNLVSYDSSEGNSSNRAWWAENGTTGVSLNGISLYDDITTKQIVVGEVGGNGTVTINGVALGGALTSFLVQRY